MFYNSITGDLITLQFKYRLNQILYEKNLAVVVSDYKNTDFLLLGLSTTELYNQQLLINNSHYNNLIIQNYNYLEYEVFDPNLTIEIFN